MQKQLSPAVAVIIVLIVVIIVAAVGYTFFLKKRPGGAAGGASDEDARMEYERQMQGSGIPQHRVAARGRPGTEAVP